MAGSGQQVRRDFGQIGLMPDEQCPFKLPGPQFDEYISPGVDAVEEGSARGKGAENLRSVLHPEPAGDDLRGLPAPSERTAQDEIGLQPQLANADGLLLQPDAAGCAQFTLSIRGDARLLYFNGNSVAHQV